MILLYWSAYTEPRLRVMSQPTQRARTVLILQKILYTILKGLYHQFLRVFFITYDIKSVLSVWTLMVLNFFYSGFLLIFKDEVLMYMAQNDS
jgi:hypothetical protein